MYFSDLLDRIDRTLFKYLHDGQSQKPFTISRLQGDITTDGKQLYLSQKITYQWSVNALSSPVVL